MFKSSVVKLNYQLRKKFKIANRVWEIFLFICKMAKGSDKKFYMFLRWYAFYSVLVPLVEKRYPTFMEDVSFKLYDAMNILVLTPLLAKKNRTFKTLINLVEVYGLATMAQDKENILWKKRYGHLSFNNLSQLNSKKVVLEMHVITTLERSCITCMMATLERSCITCVMGKHSLTTCHWGQV